MDSKTHHLRTWPRRSFRMVRVASGLAVRCLVLLLLAGCAGQVDRHGHLFTDVDLNQIQPGMSQDQVRLTLGTPDTTGTIDGDVFYYISSTRKTLPAGRPKVVDRKIVAVYFDKNQTVNDVGRYGLKDGRVINIVDGETPTYGRKLTAIEQLFGNIANRRSILQGTQ